jgi:hypothetical protein
VPETPYSQEFAALSGADEPVERDMAQLRQQMTSLKANISSLICPALRAHPDAENHVAWSPLNRRHNSYPAMSCCRWCP